MQNNETNPEIELIKEVLKEINDKMESRGFDAAQKLIILNKISITTMGMVISSIDKSLVADVMSSSFEEMRRYAEGLEELAKRIQNAN